MNLRLSDNEAFSFTSIGSEFAAIFSSSLIGNSIVVIWLGFFILITSALLPKETPDDKWRSFIVVLIELSFVSHFKSICLLSFGFM